MNEIGCRYRPHVILKQLTVAKTPGHGDMVQDLNFGHDPYTGDESEAKNDVPTKVAVWSSENDIRHLDAKCAAERFPRIEGEASSRLSKELLGFFSNVGPHCL